MNTIKTTQAPSTSQDYTASDTHEVFNQLHPLENQNLFTQDKALSEAVNRNGGQWGNDELSRFGELTGSSDVIEWGFLSNKKLSQIKHGK
jgi:hypothetical protein